MKGLNEFIIEIGKAFSDTISHGSLTLYTDYRTKQHEQSNRTGKVVSIPMQFETDVKPGAEVLIDPTVLFRQSYRKKEQESQFLVNKEKGWYRVEPNMIILYKNPGEEWKGHLHNLLVDPITDENEETDSGLFIGKEKLKHSYAKVAFVNSEMESQGVSPGDVIAYPTEMDWPFELEGKKYLYLRSRDLLAKVSA